MILALHPCTSYRTNIPSTQCRQASSVNPNSSTVFFHPFSTIFSNGTPSCNLWITHATPPTAEGSLRPFTGRPYTNASGFVPGGKYTECNDGGRDARWVLDAWVDVIEHHGASVMRYMSRGREVEFRNSHACFKHNFLRPDRLGRRQVLRCFQ